MVNFSSSISLLLGSIILLHFAFLLDASSDQASALLSFKRSSIKIDPNNSLSSWGSGNPCSWSGVICSGEGNRVLSGLNLSNLGLIGRLSLDDLFSLRELQEINLRGNSFYGNLAAKMAISCAVESLDLSGNNFSGSVPASLGSCRSLRKLDLSRNQFSGEIPPELDGICSTLMELDLSGNKLAGGLPSGFSSCSSLEVLDLGDNQLSGDFIEETLHALPSLRRLRLAFNNISGDLPILSLKNNTQLEEIDFSANEFAGEIPAGVCSAFPSLRKLKLQDNFISGKLPADLGTCKNLTSLDLSFNELAGEIPPAIWSLPELVDLAMWGNKLSGDVPDELCSKGDNLETLILNHNEISGAIPPSIGNCRHLVWLSLSGNKLAGKIPSAIGNLQNLAILQLGHNSLTGPIPSSIGRSRNLVWVDLSSNNLSGPIPSSMASSSGFVFPGAVTGKDFAFLRNVGDGSSCAGTGVIFEFAGIRPERLASFPLIHACPATRIYTGTAVYTFAGNGTMIYLDLSCNSLSGSIPEDMGSMIFLQVLNLEQNQLSGEIPDVFGELKSIGVLDLSHNRLSGSIPGALGSLSFLVDLDVSNNYLSGEIPPAGQLQTFNPSKFANNSALCGVPLPPCSRRSSGDRSASNPSSGISIAGILIGVAISVLLLLVALVLAFQKLGKKKAILGKREDSEIFHLPDSGVAEPLGINAAIFEKPLRRLTFAQLMEGTNGFSQETLIGSGGFGEVYKATLDDGGIVAVKKLVHVTDQGDREFIAEMETLGKIKHRNLVPLLGFCKIRDERLLVYDYMKHGSLETILHGATMKLDWPARKKIAVGSARGLAFLHHSCIPHIIHRDMKSSNVLLDADLEARVSDFGMARLVSAVDTHLSVSTLAGTPGYVPPEYYQSFRCTTKGDVYSYGVLLLELLSGRRPIDQKEFGESDNLAEWAKRMVEENRREEIFDPQLRGDSAAEKELEQYLKIACWCLDERPLRRPTMIQVMAMFKEQTVDGDNETLDGFYIGL